MIVIIMGISGSGKTTVGRGLAERLGVLFYEGDDFHSEASVVKMSAGIPLTDEDRRPWLDAISSEMQTWQQAGGAVLACSALKDSYRAILRRGQSTAVFVLLDGPRELILDRIKRRKGHYFPASLVDSQLETLERPSDAFVVDILLEPEEIIEKIMTGLAECGPAKP